MPTALPKLVTQKNKIYLCGLSAGLSGITQVVSGKSGQQRATHRLMAGFVMVGGNTNYGGKKVPQKITTSTSLGPG